MVAENLWKAARESFGETQAEFAERLGVSRAYLGMLETGKRTQPRPWVLKELRRLLSKRGNGSTARAAILRRVKGEN